MNGAESLIRTAIAAGVEVCFANPGTTEMPLVAALDSVEGLRAILGLFEGVCTGAADGYGRMAEKPALTLLHLGPGFANGIANLHNARRARSPIVNLIGDQATWHVGADAPLTSNIVSLATPVSGWIRSVRSAASLAGAAADAIAVAGHAPGQIATLIIPSDCQWDPAESAAAPIEAPAPPAVSESAVKQTAQMMRKAMRVAILLGGTALRERGLKAAARIVAKSGCNLIAETFPSRVERGVGMPAVDRLPYFPEQALETLKPFDLIVLAGAKKPVAFFGYPNLPSYLVPEGASLANLAEPTDDVPAALEALASELGAPVAVSLPSKAARAERPSGKLDATAAGAAIACTMPERSIVMDEAATTGLPFFNASANAPAHTYLALTGGAIGQGLPCATGAAVACPDRRVIAFQADGSGMYTVQSLWTQARESLNVTTVLCNNHSYRILQVELARAGIKEPGPKARSLTDLSNPDIDWSMIARGLGVPSVRVETAEALTKELERSFATPGPYLIEMLL
ncbi:MAG: acetolactate synthase large subunit [Candidatus Binatus sp.]|uniref:acetolactate synthase large subunit n=1 Tax=Candidatus Binatus sp. TaxID=2811406 RepID=UPI002726CD5E|nr:acetolactate synthase large subunit [Candidatus Binatus sp.]MDO8433075.1 acetolactate synthase large subunit [Candidatus Binatus sp.]